MSLKISTQKNSNNLSPIPTGTYLARCISVIDLGTQEDFWDNKLRHLQKIRLTWETPSELKVFKEENGKQPYVISKEYTASLSPSSHLKRDLENWKGRAFTQEEIDNFDSDNLLDKVCQIQVMHKQGKEGKIYPVISGIVSVPRGMSVPPRINDLTLFDFDKYDQSIFDALPEFIQNKIKKSKEWEKIMSPHETTFDNNLDSLDGVTFSNEYNPF
jgi:hypothetical protein